MLNGILSIKFHVTPRGKSFAFSVVNRRSAKRLSCRKRADSFTAARLSTTCAQVGVERRCGDTHKSAALLHRVGTRPIADRFGPVEVKRFWAPLSSGQFFELNTCLVIWEKTSWGFYCDCISFHRGFFALSCRSFLFFSAIGTFLIFRSVWVYNSRRWRTPDEL